MAGTTEEWLAGRCPQQQLLNTLAAASIQFKPLSTLPPRTAAAVHEGEEEMVQVIRRYCRQARPDADGQRVLFSKLSEINKQRSLALMHWRREQVKTLLSDESAKPAHTYLKWEAAWLPLWIEEAGATSALQTSLLRTDNDGSDDKALLKDLLRIRMRAGNITEPPVVGELNTVAKERLTVLTRTAEQLLRMDRRASRGALTRVRRLSRKLSDLTESFQKQRLRVLSGLLEKQNRA